MKTQNQQIKAARFAYIIQLSRSASGMMRRYAVYLQPANGELAALWPHDSNEGKDANLLPGQVYSKRRDPDTLPAYHFALKGCGFSAADEIRQVLLKLNPKLEVRRLNPGWSPGATMM